LSWSALCLSMVLANGAFPGWIAECAGPSMYPRPVCAMWYKPTLGESAPGNPNAWKFGPEIETFLNKKKFVSLRVFRSVNPVFAWYLEDFFVPSCSEFYGLLVSEIYAKRYNLNSPGNTAVCTLSPLELFSHFKHTYFIYKSLAHQLWTQKMSFNTTYE
jgi:hypothetical protein